MISFDFIQDKDKFTQRNDDSTLVTQLNTSLMSQTRSLAFSQNWQSNLKYQSVKGSLSLNEAFEQQRPSTVERLLQTKILSVEEELKEQDDDELEMKAKKIQPSDPIARDMNSQLYKNIDRVIEKKKLYNQKESSLYTAMLEFAQTEQGETKQNDNNQIQKGFKRSNSSMTIGVLNKTLLPRNFGIVGGQSLKTQSNVLNTNSFGIGDQYAKVIGAGLKNQQLKNVANVILKNNRLTLDGINELTNSISNKVIGLDLQGNQLGMTRSFQPDVILKINKKFASLQELNLEHNNITDQSARSLFKELMESTKLQKLNLSQNRISDLSALDLYEFVVYQKTLLEFNLHWNYLNSQGGKLIALALMQNSSIKVLDLSHNSIGLQSKVIQPQLPKRNRINTGPKAPQIHTAADAWVQYFKSSDPQLIHLDISQNSFSLEDSDFIADALQSNHSLYGFHFQGNGLNKVFVDSKGFLIVPMKIQNALANMITDKVQYTVDIKLDKYNSDHYIPGVLKHRRIQGIQSLSTQEGQVQPCWICDGWIESQIIYQPDITGISGEPVYVHFSHEGYAPVMMSKNQQKRDSQKNLKRVGIQFNTSEWTIKRMLPPKSIVKFFFTCPLTKQSGISKLHETATWKADERKKKVVYYTYKDGKIKRIMFLRPPQLNIIRTGDPKQIFSINKYGGIDTLITCVPRQQDAQTILNISETQLKQFDKEQIECSDDDSVEEQNFFDDAIAETDELYDACFETDWNKSIITQLIKNEDEIFTIKTYLRTIYNDIVTAYRYLSVQQQSGDYGCLSLNQYTEFFSSLVVNSKYGHSDLDFQYKQCVSKHKGSVRQQTQLSLIRFQFLEMIVRLAVDKYCKSDPNFPVYAALQKFYDKDKLCDKIDSFEKAQVWRENVFWEPECNRIIQYYYSTLEGLYEQAFKFRVLNYYTSVKFVTPSAFRELFQNAQMINDNNVERNINIAYSLSIFPIRDEVNSDKIIQMNFYEFVEALFRVADKINLQNIGKVELIDKITYIIQSLAKSYKLQVPNEDDILDSEEEDKIEEAKEIQHEQFRKFLARNSSQLNYEIEFQESKKPKKKLGNFQRK